MKLYEKMSHISEQNCLAKPLRLETSDNGNPQDNYEEKDSFSHGDETDYGDSLGPLPPKWEKAYTENGEVYFIDHSTGTSHWLDPRLSKFQKKSLEDCLDDELPYGWEKISDPHYGTYFIDHVNRRTQYENPVIQAKRAASHNSNYSNQPSRTSFTKDPSELCGQRFRTSLVKSSRGLGITIVGGDDGVDEFLQIKSVVTKGPAWLDGQLQTGDVIVYVNDTCVLGYTHNQIVRLFQSIPVGSTVSLEVCRGYPLPFDPNDPNTEVVTTVAVDGNIQPIPNDKTLLDTNYNFLDSDNLSHTDVACNTSSDINDMLKGISNMSLSKTEVKVSIVKGSMGFGFTIADSACGQRVKKILDRQRCKNLMEGDILLEINDISLKNMSHDEVVQVLKKCPYNSEATICVQRGSSNKTPNIRNKPRKLDNRFNAKEIGSAYRSKTPTADIYSTQTREVLPSRPKTPLIDTRVLSKTPIRDMNSNASHDACKRDSNNTLCDNNCDCSRLRLSLIDNPDEDIDIPDPNIQNKASYDYHSQAADPKYGMYLPVLQHCDCNNCYSCVTRRPYDPCDHFDSAVVKKSDGYEWTTSYIPSRPEYITTAVTLNREETGFGFRIVGGIEDKSQVAVGHIVAGGAADMDGRIRSGDEIVSVDGFSVLKASHHQVVQLMNAAAARGQVNLVLRRPVFPAQPVMGGSYSMEGTWENPPPPLMAHPSMMPSHHPGPYDVHHPDSDGFTYVVMPPSNKVCSIGK